MQSFETVKALIARITYKDWTIKVMKKGDGFLIQPIFIAPDFFTKQPEEQKCRKWYVSPHMVDTEIIRTCFLAIQQAEMHELCENFIFDGQQIYNPHINLTDLAQSLSQNIKTETRN